MKIDSTWTLFLDRDGVINKLLPGAYVQTIDEFEFNPGVLEALNKAANLFSRIVVVTNQQGIGKGLMSERNLFEIHTYCKEKVVNANGRIDEFYFAPELASANSPFRKPNTGMALKAKEDFPEIDFSKSIIVGDSDSDIEMGQRLGMKTVYISQFNTHPTADATYNSLLEMINRLES